jgi:hypothetical protein
MKLREYRIEFKDWYQFVWATDEASAQDIAREIFYDSLTIDATGEVCDEYEG